MSELAELRAERLREIERLIVDAAYELIETVPPAVLERNERRRESLLSLQKTLVDPYAVLRLAGLLHDYDDASSVAYDWTSVSDEAPTEEA